MENYKRGRPSHQSPPESPDEYRWVNNETNEIDYIGETNNLSRREYEHERSDKPVSTETHTYAWQEADENSTSESRREHESEKISEHDPSLHQP